MKRKKVDKKKPRTGSIRCTWAQCPNKICTSREFAYFDVDYDQDKFFCGTCGYELTHPQFNAKLGKEIE